MKTKPLKGKRTAISKLGTAYVEKMSKRRIPNLAKKRLRDIVWDLEGYHHVDDPRPWEMRVTQSAAARQVAGKPR